MSYLIFFVLVGDVYCGLSELKALLLVVEASVEPKVANFRLNDEELFLQSLPHFLSA